VRHGRRRRKRTRNLPTLYIRAFATFEDSTDDNAISWDTDDIPFVIDNSATGIICSVGKLFIGPLISTKVTLETAEGLTTKTKFVGTIRLVMTCDHNKQHWYDIPGSFFDPDSPINLIGIPFLGDYFGKNDKVPNSDDDGTWVKSSASRSQFTWDYRKNERHFSHGSSRLPELYLYV